MLVSLTSEIFQPRKWYYIMIATPDVTVTELDHMYMGSLTKQEAEAIFNSDTEGTFIKATVVFHGLETDSTYDVHLLHRSVCVIYDGEEVMARAARWTRSHPDGTEESRREYVHFTGGNTPQLLFFNAQHATETPEEAQRSHWRVPASEVLKDEAELFFDRNTLGAFNA